jgi:hypothetical protein
MKRFLGCVLGAVLVVAGGALLVVECLDHNSKFIFFGYVFASLIALGGILLIWASLARYRGGLWSAAGYLLAGAGVVCAVSSLDDFLQKIGRPSPKDFSLCSILCMLGAGFLVHGHIRHRAAAQGFAGTSGSRSKPLVPVWVGCLLSGIFFWHWISTELALKSFVEHSRRAGLPMDLGELIRMRTAVGADRNAAVLYSQAFTNLTKRAEISMLATNLVCSTEISATDLNAVAELTKRNRKVLELLHRAATFAQSNYSLQTNETPASLTRQFGPAADCADLLFLEAVQRSTSGNSAAAIDSIVTMLRLGDSLANEPSFAAQNRRGFCNSLAFDATARLLAQTNLEQSILARLAAAFRTTEETTDYTGAYLNELCEALQAEPSRCIDVEFSNRPFVAAAYKAVVLITDREAADKLHYGNNTLAYLKALKNPYPLRLQMLPDPNQALAYANRHGYFVSAYPLAWRNALAMSQAENCARLRVVQGALAAERHRLTRGDFPQRLQDISPQIASSALEDPFDGYPLRYSSTAKGFLIYSVGKDRKDNAGQPRRPDQLWTDSYDISIRVQHPDPASPSPNITSTQR